MINPFCKIKENSRYTMNDRTIVVQETNMKGVSFYYLDDWNALHYMSKLEFIFNAQKYKFA